MDFSLALPEQILRDIFLRIPYKYQSKIKQLLKPAKEIMECLQFYQDRIMFGLSRKYICFLQPAGISIYDPADQSCEMLAPIPTGFEISDVSHIVCVNHKLVLLGLKYYVNFTTRILIYDLLFRTWNEGAEIPTTRSVFPFACASSERSIYIAGGLNKYMHGLREAAVYKVDEDKWELLPEMHQEVGICKGVFIEGMFYVTGISNDRSQRFDPSTGVWTTIVNMSMYNSWQSHVLYAFGQLNAFRRFGIKQYDWERNVWRELDAFPRELTFVRAAVWYDRIFVFGYQKTSALLRFPFFYMYKPGAALSERWISVDKPEKFLDMALISVITIEI